MQPKFTRRSLMHFLTGLSAIALILVCSAQVSYSQQREVKSKAKQTINTSLVQYKAQIMQGRAGEGISKKASNDAGVITARNIRPVVARTEAVCATFTGALAPGDLTMTNRLNRNAIQGVCPGPKPYAGNLTGNTYYDLITWTNNSGLAQCATFTLTTTDVTTNIEFGVYSGAFNPADLSANFFTDPGVSSATPPAPTTCSANVAAGQSLTFVVFTPNAALQTASDYTLTVDMPICASAPCAGTPTPGNTISSVPTVCPAISFTLSLQNSTPGSGVTYQWQSGPSATGPWTNFGTNSSTQTLTQSAATYYRCQVTCSGNTGTSTPVQVLLTPASGCYCTPPASNCTLDDEILNVTFGTLNNSSSGCSGSGYTNYTALPAPNAFSGAANPISVTIGPGGADNIGVWIDYNQNGQFEVSEFTFLGNVSSGTVNGNINIPSSALSGTTRMRVRVDFSTAMGGGDACTGYTFSETEDYNVNITPCVPVTITAPPASASITCGSNASFTVTTAGSGPTFSWEYRVNASGVWQTVPASGIYSGTNTATLVLTNVSQAFNGYQYRALVTGACSAIDFSAPATLTVSAIVPVVTPSSATICLGTIQQLTLTNTVSAPITTTFNATGLPSIIPDNDLTGLEKQITVSGIPVGAVITNISVNMSITHTFVGDLVLNMTSPTNQVLNMFALLDGFTGSNSTANFTNTKFDALSTTAIAGAPAPRTGTFKPEGWAITAPANFVTNVTSIAPMLTINPNGVWKLLFADAGLGDEGTLTALSISFTYTAPTFAQGIWTGPAGTMFTDNLATTAYTGTPATTIYVKPTVTSNYQVSFTTLTPCTSATTTVPVTVVNPVGTVTNPTNKTVCVGGSTTFTSSATGGPNTYQWQVSTDGGLTYNNITGATATSYTLSGITQAMNNYRYRLAITAAPCAGTVNSTAAILTVNALPTVTITSPDLSLTPGQTTTITATSSPAAATANSWSWTLDGSSISGTTNTQVVGVDGFGAYQATVTDVNGCVNSSNQLTIGGEASDRLWIYPNPSEGPFQVRLYYAGPVTEKRVVSIFQANGQLVGKKEFDLTNVTSPYLRMDFDLSGLAAGTYVVKVHNTFTNKIVSGLVVIQH